ncbi:DUF4956 domain-containing protein [Corynebacterium sp. CCUG 18816]|uniref:DUF4956 domain-containing protein n=1 Tax=Corynebacterium pseudogenitalium TaxID=38303 RepID=UPI00210B6893|nr:DUF4956 domain-containing protein [Corynebacterium pseudogenitalium]MCQ4617318.1 DUF4956 domain-containing protein [Corynebacterium pseudogenitalium]
MTNTLVLLAIDAIAIAVLVFGIYMPNHQRGDLVVAFLGMNVGVLAVATTLTSSEVGVGLGMGLFGVLSIVRLRSSEISQREIAYYFGALAIGLICGIGPTPTLAAVCCAIVVATLAVADLRLAHHRTQTINLDHAYADQNELKERIAALTGAEVLDVEVLRLDVVNDTTLVTARLRDADTEAAIKSPVGVR